MGVFAQVCALVLQVSLVFHAGLLRLSSRVVTEGVLDVDQKVDHDTHGEDVDLVAVVALAHLLLDLGCHVGQGTCVGRAEAVLAERGHHSHVANLGAHEALI